MFGEYEEIGKYTINVTIQGKLLSSKLGPQNPTGGETEMDWALLKRIHQAPHKHWCCVLLWRRD